MGTSNNPSDDMSAIQLTRYEIVATRRHETDELLWQTPALCLTAQSFLFTIALSHQTDSWDKVLASALSMVVAVGCIQLMAKHRYYEVSDSEWLEAFEGECKAKGNKVDHGCVVRFYRPGVLSRSEIGKSLVSILAMPSSFWLWELMQFIFLISGTFIIFRTLC